MSAITFLLGVIVGAGLVLCLAHLLGVARKKIDATAGGQG